MKIFRSSLLYRYVYPFPSEGDWKEARTVCMLFLHSIRATMFWVLFVMFLPVLALAWIGARVEKFLKSRTQKIREHTYCPWSVEFTEKEKK